MALRIEAGDEINAELEAAFEKHGEGLYSFE